jgi:cellulose synthase/poly-beta-1,6-N-acetylglucosamine synthase-like glycosyltransferase
MGWTASLLGAAASAAGGLTWYSWLTLAAALTFTVAGVILVLVGWLFLPRHADTATPAGESGLSGGTARVLGGACVGVAAMVAGAYALSHSGAWATGAWRGLGLLWQYGPGAAVAVLTALSAWLGRGLEDLGRLLVAGFDRARPPVLGVLSRAVPTVERELRVGLAASQYRLINTGALLAAATVGGFAGWMSTSSRWRLSGVVTWLGLDLLALGLLGLSALLIERSHGLLAQGLGVGILAVETFGMFLFLAYQFYTLEYITGRPRAAPEDSLPPDPTYTPFVAVQVASYNEPPDLVRRCLASVLALDWPKDRLFVQLADDSTDGATVEALWSFCRERGVEYLHREDRRGFKGGALNDASRTLPPEVAFVAVVDADYEVDPSFLRVAVPPFRAARVGFVQTPQAYRNDGVGTLARWYALADAYFYRVVQPVRARVQSLIFCGTMGVLRRRALAAAGGWSETCVTEDAGLSLRLLAGGWRGVYVDTTVGWGLAPAEMSAVRSQHRRWAFGGMQMLRMNRGNLVAARLTQRQRTDFKMSGLFWVDGIFLLCATAVLGALAVAGWFGVSLSLGSLSAVAIVAAFPLLLMLDGALKLRVALRASTPVTLTEAFGVMAFWYAIKLNDLRAALRGWAGYRIPFVRTPKRRAGAPGRATAFRGALVDSAFETTIFALLVGVIGVSLYRFTLGVRPTLPALFLVGWLVYYALAYLSALAFDYYSRVAVDEAASLPRPVRSGVAEPRSGGPPGRPTA